MIFLHLLGIFDHKTVWVKQLIFSSIPPHIINCSSPYCLISDTQMGRQNMLYNIKSVEIHFTISDWGIYSRRHAEEQATLVSNKWLLTKCCSSHFSIFKEFCLIKDTVNWLICLPGSVSLPSMNTKLLGVFWKTLQHNYYAHHWSASLLEFLVFHWLSCM